MTKRTWIGALFVLLGLVWCGYSALALFGAEFPDYGDDKIFIQIQGLEISVVWWRWLAVSLLLGITYKLLGRGADVL